MSAALPVTDALAGYQLRLPTFEGPMDVLLSLIERDRLEISDLSLVAVTDGFLAYIDGLHDPPPALLAEFAGIAARLLVLKSRSLLPRPEPDEGEPEIDDLASQLREYQQMKRAAEQLRERHLGDWRTFSRGRLALESPTRVVLVPSPVGHLRRALQRTLSRARPAPELAALTPVVTISEMVSRLRNRLAAHGRATFHDLAGITRPERIAGFIALLAMWRRGEVSVSQHGLFGEITVERDRLAAAEVAHDD